MQTILKFVRYCGLVVLFLTLVGLEKLGVQVNLGGYLDGVTRELDYRHVELFGDEFEDD